ncbi:hypothetical protein KUTeg_024635 [Tegillarca granosa]|uniref:CUB domain-containing protein n=1 Tax=Tegillarca granosa TaxID=220873 RepID=A0ABQ9DYF3_TEGGR|nr:hypothetical protein KUTeg_024635 [Tegillarca granosa]
MTYFEQWTSYLNDLMCHWLIRSSNMSERVMIEVVELSIEDDDDCMYDYLRIYDDMLNSLEKDGSSGKSKTSHTMVIIGGIIGGVLCSLLLLAFVCICATTKKCQCCRKPRRTVHPNSANSVFQNMRSHPEHEGSSTPPSDDIPLHALPVYTISPSVPPPYLDSYCHPPEEPYPAHVISGYSACRLPSSPPPPYSLTDPHAHLYTVPNCISSHTPLHRH